MQRARQSTSCPTNSTTERKTRKVPHSDAVRNLSPIGESLAEFLARRHEIKSDRFSPRRVRGEKHLSRSVCRAAILAGRGTERSAAFSKKRQSRFLEDIISAPFRSHSLFSAGSRRSWSCARCRCRARRAPCGGRSRSIPPAGAPDAAAFPRSAGPCCRR